MALVTTKWDAADGIDTVEDVIANLDAALEDGDPAVIASMLGAIARSKGMSQIAREAGISREGLYKALSAEGDPKLSTLLSVLKALGLSMRVQVTKAAA